jgi:hypothetical protein
VHPCLNPNHKVPQFGFPRPLFAADNGFDGSLPTEVGDLVHLYTLDMSKYPYTVATFLSEMEGLLTSQPTFLIGKNSLSGTIPVQLGKCEEMVQLDLCKSI